MRRTALSLLMVLAATGCARKSDVEDLEAKLSACEQDREAERATAAACKEQLEVENRRWSSIERQLSTTLPETVRSFEEERARILSAVPESVRREVGRRFDDYAVRMSKEFESVHGEMQAMRAQLDAAHVTLGDVKQTTTQIRTDVGTLGTARAEESGALRKELADQDRIAAAVVTRIVDFDKKYVDCKRCPEDVKLKGRSREVLARFHADLIKELQALQASEGAL